MSVVNRISYIFRSAAAGVALGVAGLAAAPAAGQLDGGAALAELNRPDYIHRDIQIFAQGLALDDAQRMIIDALFQDYLDSFEKGWNGTQAKIQEVLQDVQGMEQQRDQSRILDAVIAPFAEWRTQKQRLKAQFEDDVQAILNSEQAERWPQFMQQMTREKTLHLGRLSGESLNLFHIVRELRMDDRVYMDLEPVLDQYSQELHMALLARNQVMERGQNEFIQGLRSQGNVPAPRYIPEEIAARVRIRDVNMSYLDEIANRLPGDNGDRFKERALESAFPRIHRTLPAMRLITRALELEDLEDETREQIEEIRATYLAEMEHLNNGLRQVTLQFEPRQLRNQAEIAASRHTGETVERIEDTTRPKYTERDERAQYYMQLVQGLLTPEQAQLIPTVERRTSGARDPRGGGVIRRGAATPAEVQGGERPQRPARDGGDRGQRGDRGGR